MTIRGACGPKLPTRRNFRLLTDYENPDPDSFVQRKSGTVGHRPAYSAGESGSMQFTPILVFLICVGAIGLLSGATAMSFRKGSRRHRMTGNVFVISMLSLGASGAYLGFMKHQV